MATSHILWIVSGQNWKYKNVCLIWIHLHFDTTQETKHIHSKKFIPIRDHWYFFAKLLFSRRDFTFSRLSYERVGVGAAKFPQKYMSKWNKGNQPERQFASQALMTSVYIYIQSTLKRNLHREFCILLISLCLEKRWIIYYARWSSYCTALE